MQWATKDKEEKKAVVKRHFSHIFFLSPSRKLKKLVSDVGFIQNATMYLLIE